MSLWFYIGLLLLLVAAVLLFSSQAFDKKGKVIVAVLSLFVVPLITVGLYFQLGQPDMPSQALASRGSELAVHNMVKKAEEFIAKNPDDIRGHEVLAPVYTRFERFDDLVKTRRALLRLKGENTETLADLGEALVLSEGGKVNFEALNLFQKIIKTNANHIGANYYLAIAKFQNKDRAGAIADLKALLNKSRDAPEKAFITQEIERLSKQ